MNATNESHSYVNINHREMNFQFKVSYLYLQVKTTEIFTTQFGVKPKTKKEKRKRSQ